MTTSRTRGWRRIAGTAAAIALVAAACGGDDAAEPAEEPTTEETTAEATEDTTEPAEEGTDEVEVTQDGGVLAAIQARGTLNCGVSGAAVAFSYTQADGSMEGIDADYCRAVAAAVLGDSEAVEFTALTAAERFTAVQTGAVDVLMRNSTWTQSRDTEVGMDFGPTTYYDGQQLMARASDGFSAASEVAEIDGAIVCTNAGTTTETNISELALTLGITIDLQTFEDYDQVTDAFIAGTCDVITTDGSGLVGRKAAQEPEGEEWVIFPATPISKEPLGPVYGQNDSQWADVVNWVVYATLIADEYGVTSADVDDALAGEFGPEMTRLMGGEGELQSVMGLSADAFYNVISQVGNYQEIWDANLTPVGLVREGSANALWSDGGLMYAPPAR
ncbi:MAG: amino acid ABC transporter substrate-binding protein [Ilumatobacteraceae bacterium]|jgi:general L-amino acid transport system substrate-binding protein